MWTTTQKKGLDFHQIMGTVMVQTRMRGRNFLRFVTAVTTVFVSSCVLILGALSKYPLTSLRWAVRSSPLNSAALSSRFFQFLSPLFSHQLWPNHWTRVEKTTATRSTSTPLASLQTSK